MVSFFQQVLLLIIISSSSLALNWDDYCQSDTCKCGIHHVGKSGITTPGHVDRFEYPYIAALMVDKVYRCSGTVITKHHAVTAAHCLDKVEASNMVVRVGVWDISNAHETAKDYGISKFVIHEGYLPKTYANDIALVVTTEEIRFSSGVGPVCLPFGYKTKQPGDLHPADVTVLGWGVNTDPTQIDKLKKATYSIESFEKCHQSLNVTSLDPKLCLLDEEARSNVCLMDYGGPVLWKKDESSSFHLIGVVSVASTCRTPRPIFNTFVPLLLDWIKQHTTGECLCENP